MKQLEKIINQASVRRIGRRWQMFGLCAFGAASLLALVETAKADSTPLSQLGYLQTLAQVSGDGGQFTSGSTPADYMHWAQSKGLNPSGGWQPSANVSKNVIAQTLVQLFDLSPTKLGGDYARILTREGIDLSSFGDVVTKENLVSLLDQSAFQTRIVISASNGTGSSAKSSPVSAPSNPTRTPGSPHKITICHKGHIRITIDQRALDAHLAHGDSIGPCFGTQVN